MHENLWAGVGLKVEHAGFFLRQMQAALDRLRGQRPAMLEAAGATVDIQWQPAFYANLDAFLVMARRVPEVINSCFGKDTANKEMRNWFAGHARQAGGDSTLKLRRHGYGGLGAKSSVAVRCKGARSTASRIVLRPQYHYQALRLKAHRCAAAGLDSGIAAARLASMPSTP